MNDLLDCKIKFRSIQFDVETYRNGVITCFIYYAWYDNGYTFLENYTARNTDDFLVRNIKACIPSSIVSDNVPAYEKDVLLIKKGLPKNKVQVGINALIPPVGSDDFKDIKDLEGEIPEFPIEIFSNGQLVDENGNADFDWRKNFHYKIDNNTDCLDDIRKYREFFCKKMLRIETAIDLLVPNITYKFDHSKIHVGDYLLTSRHIVSKVRSVGGAYIEMADGTSDYSDVLRPLTSNVLALEELSSKIFSDAFAFSEELSSKDSNYAHLIQEYIRDKYHIEIPLASDILSAQGMYYLC